MTAVRSECPCAQKPAPWLRLYTRRCRSHCPRRDRQHTGWVQATGHPEHRKGTRRRLRAVSPTALHCARRNAGSANQHQPQKRHRSCGVVPTTRTDPDPENWLPVFARKVTPRATLYETYVEEARNLSAHAECGLEKVVEIRQGTLETEPARASREGARQKNKHNARAPWKDNLADDSSSRARPERLFRTRTISAQVAGAP